MHDLDRTTMESYEFDQDDELGYDDEFDYDNEFDQDDEFGDDDEMSYDDEFDDEMDEDDEYDDYEFDDNGYDQEFDDYEYEGPISQDDEMELASQLLSANSDEELDQFFGGLISSVAGPLIKGAAKRIFGSKRGRRRVRRYKRKARRLTRYAMRKLPRKYRSLLGGLSGILGFEVGGMSPEDQEFELAKGLVRFNKAAVKNLAKMPARMSDDKAINLATRKAAAKHLPGLLRKKLLRRGGSGRKGRWYRKGNRIIVVGA